jgi:Kef-type K+ transport system membrane component KefB
MKAFPVLCRILTELKLLDTPVGVIVLSAGVGNDVVGEFTPRCFVPPS